MGEKCSSDVAPKGASASFPVAQPSRPQVLVRSRRPSHTLRERAEFVRFFEGSTVYRLRACTVFRVANELGHYRLGITLKVRSSSVERNRVRRVVREGFRKIQDRLGGFDYNVVISGAQRRLSHPYPQQLRQAIEADLPAEIVRGGRPAEPKRAEGGPKK